MAIPTSDRARRECGGTRRKSLPTGDTNLNDGGPRGIKYSVGAKPEHMTHLNAKTMVRKDHPRIAFRGYIDLMEAEILCCQLQIKNYGKLYGELGELLAFVRSLIRADVLGEPVKEISLCGYSADDLRACSHHPEEYFGQPHFMPLAADGAAIIYVNHLRAVIRQAELAGYRAFKDYDGSVTRPDIILAMNRLSSLCWIMMIKLKAGKYEQHGN